jgi:hypothetical protein
MSKQAILGSLTPQFGNVLDLSRPCDTSTFPRCPQLADTHADRVLAAIDPRHRLTNCFNRFLAPARIEAEAGAVVFLEEAQNVRYWGISLESLADVDPPVVSTANEARAAWEPEALRLSGFLQLMLAWQAVNGGWRHSDRGAELGRCVENAARELVTIEHGVGEAGLKLHAIGRAGILIVDDDGIGYLAARTARTWAACRRALRL